MPRPSVADRYKYMTSSQVCQALGISFEQLIRRIDQGILPAPTKVDASRVRLFDQSWLRIAKVVIQSSFDAKVPEASP